ncbi:MAG: peptide ABC transporter substrate-binding protein [Oscillospiraceae bacterium]|jgi:oligopeptide transport system substrate-binding protein|nr:peptide ABC transporter substrate-binding protein [Oscillospiraceae bacterium]
MHRTLALLLALLIALSFCCGCGDDENVIKGAGHSFSYTLVGNPDTLDPQLAENSSAMTVLCNLFEGLLVLDAEGKLQNGVAESYEISEDQKRYTFKLRRDSYWYQAFGDETEAEQPFGEEAAVAVTAHDFEFAFRRLFDFNYDAPQAPAFSCLKNARKILDHSLSPSQLGVKALSDYELEFTLDYPNSGFLLLLTSCAALPCNQAYFESTKGRYGLDEESIIGNGSFSMKRWLYDEYGKYNVIQLTRNPLNHKVKRVFPTDLNLYIEKTDADASKIFTTGNADCYVSTQNTLISRADYHAESAYSLTLGLIANPDSHFADENVLGALAQTLDRSAFPDGAPDILPASGILPPAVQLLNKSCRDLIADSAYVPYNPPEADRLYHKALRKLHISELEEGKIMVCAGMMDYGLLHDVLLNWGTELDMHFSIEEVPESEYEARLRSGDYVLALYAVTGAYHDATAVLERFLADPYLRCSERAAVRRLLERAAAAPVLSDCVELYRQAEELLLSDYCFIPLFYKQRYLICKNGVSDVVFNPFSGQVEFSQAKFYQS